MNGHVVRAIFKRNFVSYFSSPTGYVFICVFVLLSALAAFWPNEFFNANLANLSQLNLYLPHIMLIFIPAITMGTWAEERRQATDELILTLPATDFDVVIGKYLAAVAIFTASLAFSLISNLLVLRTLGQPDLGLFLSTYIGYWVLGLAMLAVGMVASFLTANLTVSFILGAILNAPLVFASSAEVILPRGTALYALVQSISISENFRDFGSGIISSSSLIYFTSLTVLMLYVNMILIGRRHWMGGRDGESLLKHYAIRTVALLFGVAGVSALASNHDIFRQDVTHAGLSRLSSQTTELLGKLEARYPVKIEAFVTENVPESYVQTRLNLINTLQELKKLNPDEIQVNVYPTEKFSGEADQAEQQFGITSRQVASRSRGAVNLEEIYMGIAFTCGLDKVVVPFIEPGIPVEYELVRSITTVAQKERKRIGILQTDAKLYGGFNPHSMAPSRNERIVEELEKQYKVVQVNPASPITETYDVLLAVQPSSLTQPQMDNFLAVLRTGQPTAIFEDPFPFLDPSVPGTGQPKRPQQNPGMFGGMGGMNTPPPEPKGNITALWDMLGVDISAQRVVWQGYNPYKKISQFWDEFVFIDPGSGAEKPFNPENPISSQMQQVLFLFPGFINEKPSSEMDFSELLITGQNTGYINYGDIMQTGFMGQPSINPNMKLFQRKTRDEYVMAAHITGDITSPPLPHPAASESEGADKPAAPAEAELNVVLVSDIDVMYSAFFNLRAQGEQPGSDVNLVLDNVTFVLNVLDHLAGDNRFIDIRKRRRQHRTLTRIESSTEEARTDFQAARDGFIESYESAKTDEQKTLDETIAKLRDQQGGDAVSRMREVEMAEEVYRNRMNARLQAAEKDRDRDIKSAETKLALEIQRVQSQYKLWSVVLPPLPPLLLACFVFWRRRGEEREGISRSRLR
mgnify:CR=1 FL=1|jgi:ABC-2 type transport system permease protein